MDDRVNQVGAGPGEAPQAQGSGAVALGRGGRMLRQRTMLVNAIRAHLAEFGIVAAQAGRETRRARLKCEVMAIRSSRDWEDPRWLRHKLCDEVIGTRSAEFIMARGHAYRTFRGRTHDRT